MSSGLRDNQSVLSTVAFHLVWHMLFRLFHRTTLANRPTTPVDMWTTPLPRNYPIHPHERQEEEDRTFVALNEAGTAPTESKAFNPYSLIFEPVAARNAHHSAHAATGEHATTVVSTRVSADDLEKVVARDDASVVSRKVGGMVPQGLQIEPRM
jgi:hypothetical protein